MNGVNQMPPNKIKAQDRYTERKNRRTQPKSIFGPASLIVFTLTTGILSGKVAIWLCCHLIGFEGLRTMEVDSALIYLMIYLVPSYILGVLLGVIGIRRNETRIDTAQLGVRLNLWLLLPTNLIPILCHYLGWAKI